MRDRIGTMNLENPQSRGKVLDGERSRTSQVLQVLIDKALLTRRLGGALVLAAMLASCTSSVPYRTAGLATPPECRAVFRKNDTLTSGDGSIARSLEDDPCWQLGTEEHVNYDLITAEFDDQGWVQSSAGLDRRTRTQDRLDLVLKNLEQIYGENQTNGLSIVVFVHGWHHNAQHNDSDVVHFRRFLRDMAVADNGRTLAEDKAALKNETRRYADAIPPLSGPRVVGLYVGWRGESVPVRVLNLLTFWERKNTAERVAQGSVRELFEQLDYLRDCGRTALTWRNVRKKLSKEERALAGDVGRRNVRMLTIGHSFGGLIAFEALSSGFIGSAVRATPDDYVSRLGDLVVLVNPAFEGARYEPLLVAGQRIETLKADQFPVLIVATSQADAATRYAFPIARAINTFFESQPQHERDATILAVGHNDRYRSHVLSRCDIVNHTDCEKACPTPKEEHSSTGKTRPKDERDILDERARMQALVNAKKGFKDRTTYLCNALQLVAEENAYPGNNPFWVVSTTADIMDGHNDIFNPRFVSFLRQMYLAVTLARLKEPGTKDGKPEPLSRCYR